VWFEFFFYIVADISGVTKLQNKKIVVVHFILASIYLGKMSFFSDIFRYFNVGMHFYLFRKNIIHIGWIVLFSFIVLALTNISVTV
jgi:hypothetical protein